MGELYCEYESSEERIEDKIFFYGAPKVYKQADRMLKRAPIASIK